MHCHGEDFQKQRNTTGEERVFLVVIICLGFLVVIICGSISNIGRTTIM